MKIIKKYAEFAGYTICHGEQVNEWRCPNKNCGIGVIEDYVCCPYCGQKLKFREPELLGMRMIKISLLKGGGR